VFDVRSQVSIVSLLRSGTIDADLGALVWLLAEGRTAMTIASIEDEHGRDAITSALDDLVPPSGPRPLAVRGGSLADVMARSTKRALPILGGPAPTPGLQPGLVLIVGDRVVTAAHLVRPPLRDAGGHVRKQGPAVLAVYDEAAGAWDHYAWGIGPEVADLAGIKSGDLEPELARRTEYLRGLAAAGIVGREEVRSAIHGYRHGAGLS
jgi:hypothetical protein